MGRLVVHLGLWLAVLAPACARGPVSEECPGVLPGEIVVSEIRGKQSGLDTRGEWIELYNASGAKLEPGGLVIRLIKFDKDGEPALDDEGEQIEAEIALLDSSLLIDPGGYLVAGRFPEYDMPDHADYGYEAQFSSDLYDAGRIELYACVEEPVDAVEYLDLPKNGSWGFDGGLDLTAGSNDDETNWCIDETGTIEGIGADAGLPGTPGEVNLKCD